MVHQSAFTSAPTIDLSKGDGDPRTGNIGAPQQTSTPVKQSCPSGQSSTGKKMDLSRIHATHLLHELSDCRENWQKGGPSPSSSRVTEAACGSGGSLPPGLPAQAPGLIPGSLPGRVTEVLCPSQLAPPAKMVIPSERTAPVKRPTPDEDDTAPDIGEVDEVSGSPKKKKKKKDKNREHKESATSENPGIT